MILEYRSAFSLSFWSAWVLYHCVSAPGYFVSSVGIDENVIRHYVEYQGRKDSDQLRMEL